MRNKIKVNQKVRAEPNVLLLHKKQTKWFVNSYQIKCMRALGVLCGLYMMVGVRGRGERGVGEIFGKLERSTRELPNLCSSRKNFQQTQIEESSQKTLN
jgi:hypothetical protein